jgi:hypothetical protein
MVTIECFLVNINQNHCDPASDLSGSASAHAQRSNSFAAAAESLKVSVAALKGSAVPGSKAAAFQPSFPNPAQWTTELVAKRQQEFADFLKTPEGIAESAAFDADYAEYEIEVATHAVKAPRGPRP